MMSSSFQDTSRNATQSPSRIEPISEYNRQLVNIQPQKAQMLENPVIQIPLPSGHGPASHATRELDDLMASLSDFKVNLISLQNDPLSVAKMILFEF